MITIFTIPKPFTDPHIRLIQRNAIMSWKKVYPNAEIFLIGNDAEVKETAKKLNVGHFPDVRVSSSGTPFLDSAFEIARKNSHHEIMMYINADIILVDDFKIAIQNVPTREFMMCGRRWDFDVSSSSIDFNASNWMEDIKLKAKARNNLHSAGGMDYFIFRKESFKDMPALVVGRIGWDNWMIWYCKKENIPIVDITDAITAIHQNHNYPSYNKGVERKTNPEALQNLSFISGNRDLLTTNDATSKMLADGSVVENKRSFFDRAKKSLKSFKK